MSDYVTQNGCISRLGSSIMGIVIAPILILFLTMGIYMNERNSVNVANGLAEGKAAVVTISSDKPDPGANGKLVHTTGQATTDQDVHDDMFSIRAGKVLNLRRVVEMYQWHEKETTDTQKQVGGSTRTVHHFSYTQVWEDKPEDSSHFNDHHYQNPSMPYQGELFVANPIHVGALVLPDVLARKLSGFTPLDLAKAQPKMQGFRTIDQVFYRGGSPSTPKTGDLRVHWEIVNPTAVSLLGQLQGNTLQAYATKSKTEILVLTEGTLTADQMFKTEATVNSAATWVFRFILWILIVVGFCMIFQPIQVLADVIPFIGDLVGIGLGFFGFVIGTAWTVLVIAVAWIVVRPLMGVGLLVLVGGALYGAKKMGSARRG